MSAARRPLLSHIDMRVRDRARSIVFYDALLGALEFTRGDSTNWTSYFDASTNASLPADYEWFGFTQDLEAVPNTNRIAFAALSIESVDRVAAILSNIGASEIEGPNYDEGPTYYAIFFTDPDGHHLEVCCRW
jgi:catechol 2,3-dioxygenase-like lactoylglutathione lyase family enzyme